MKKKQHPKKEEKMKGRLSTLAFVLVLSALIAGGCAPTTASTEVLAGVYWPTTDWRTSTPEEQGMDPTKLNQMMALIDEGNIAIDSVLVVRRGHIVLEEYRNAYTPQTKHHIQSVTKSFTSMLIGIAIHEGFIENVGQRMVDFFPDQAIANMDARKQAITLENLLTMSDGMDWHELDYPYSDERNTLGQMWVSGDAVQHVLDRPMVRDPGEEWAYNSGTSILLGGIIEQVTGQDVLAFAREYLFDPIGVGEVRWQKTTGNHYHTDGGLWMTPRDMARFGYLMLNNGTWDGKEIVSSEWVAQSSSAHYQTTGFYGYGYQWWTWPGTGIYAATGHYEQKIYVVPEADLVVVFTANIADKDPHPTDAFLGRFILPACDEYVTERYSKYGFSFDHPPGVTLLEAGVGGQGVASDASGMVQFNYYGGSPLELVGTIWSTAEVAPNLETALDEIFASVESGGNEVTSRGSLEVSVKDNHEMIYQRFDLTEQGQLLMGVMGSWYCDKANRVYIFSYVTFPEFTTQQDLPKEFQRHLDSFVCH